MTKEQLLKKLYEIDRLAETYLKPHGKALWLYEQCRDFSVWSYRKSINLLKDKRFQWFIAGCTVYSLPAAYRAVTGQGRLPLTPVIESSNEMIPTNLPEKILVNSVFPGATSSVVIGETINKKFEVSGYKKHVSRLVGAVTGTSLWTLLQYLGYNLCEKFELVWPHGANPFESPEVYPFNILVGLASMAVPYVVDWINSKRRKP